MGVTRDSRVAKMSRDRQAEEGQAPGSIGGVPVKYGSPTPEATDGKQKEKEEEEGKEEKIKYFRKT